MSAIQIAERTRSASFEVRTPRGVYWVTYTWRSAPFVPGEHWHCTCRWPECDHIPLVRAWLAAQVQRKEQAA